MLTQSRKNEAALAAKVAEYEKQLESSRATNASLLKTLTQITEESRNHTESIGQALTDLRRKEGQLNLINDALMRADSTTIGLLTTLRKGIGQNTDIALANNILTLTFQDQELFDGTGQQLVESGKNKLRKIAEIVRPAPGTLIEVQNARANTPEDRDLAALRSQALAQYMRQESQLSPDRVRALVVPVAADSIENISRIRIQPDFEEFFIRVKKEMKPSRGF